MASDGNPVKIPAISLVHGSQAPITVVVQQSTGKSLPPGGKDPAAAADAAATLVKSAAPGAADIQAQVTLLNKYLNDSGRPDQFRVDPTSDNKLIQQINPATGTVIGEFPVTEFPELARSVGVSGIIVDNLA
jgi:FlaG protein